MTKEETNKQLPIGTWERLTTTDIEKKPKIEFEINMPVNVEFVEDAPTEMPSQDGGVYYMFKVKANGEERVIQTSAWTLLTAIKKLGNLSGKKVSIVKKLIKGKQYFEVTA